MVVSEVVKNKQTAADSTSALVGANVAIDLQRPVLFVLEESYTRLCTFDFNVYRDANLCASAS